MADRFRANWNSFFIMHYLCCPDAPHSPWPVNYSLTLVLDLCFVSNPLPSIWLLNFKKMHCKTQTSLKCNQHWSIWVWSNCSWGQNKEGTHATNLIPKWHNNLVQLALACTACKIEAQTERIHIKGLGTGKPRTRTNQTGQYEKGGPINNQAKSQNQGEQFRLN